MTRTLFLCTLSVFLAAPTTAQGFSRNVSITISGQLYVTDPSCSITTSSPALDFGTFTASATQRTPMASTTITVGGALFSSVHGAFGGSQSKNVTLSNGSGTTLSGRVWMPTVTTTAGECSPCQADDTNDQGLIITGSCSCGISGTVTVPARSAHGTFSGSTTFSVTCNQ